MLALGYNRLIRGRSLLDLSVGKARNVIETHTSVADWSF